MCGIAGYIHLDGRETHPDYDDHLLRGMGLAMEHRGPDETRTMLWRNVAFVFKRLSIVDVEGGHQPFEAEGGRICAMVNGEIYNHRAIRREFADRFTLATESDCEVIPFLYLDRDRRLFDPVNGMFACALLDRLQGRVMLARDRLGIKPLFYALVNDGKTLVFASELKAMFAHPGVPRRFDWHAALTLTDTRHTDGRELPSFYRGIQRLPAGHLLDLDLRSGRLETVPYWRLADTPMDEPGNVATCYVDRYRELLEDSVRSRLMSDVGLGVFLSGGVDSAAVTALAARYMDVPTFSVAAGSTVGSGDVAASMRVAAHTGQVNHQVFFEHSGYEVTPAHWRNVLWACELPSATAEQLYKYYLHAFARRRYPGLKVMLLGQGADEFAGGYLQATLGDPGPYDISYWDKLGAKLRSIDILQASLEAGYLLDHADLIKDEVLSGNYIRQAVRRAPGRSTLQLYRGYYRFNLDYHLWHEDRTSSAHSIESRVPFLDHRLVELTARVPEVLHAELFTDKQIIRRAVADLLPPDICQRPKGPFFYGEAEHLTFQMMYALLLANDRELIEQAIAGSACSDGPLVGDKLHQLASRVADDPMLAGLPQLLQLVNMGVLAEMACSAPHAPAADDPLPVRELPVAEASGMVAAHATSRMAADLASPEQLVPRLARGVRFAAGAAGQSPRLLPAQGEPVVIRSPGWATFLAAIDGSRSVADIIAAHSLSRSRTLKALREAAGSELLDFERVAGSDSV